ncbi:unannotated protein [freshwater metagenome]|uniref:Unannotated protein n=1 Tax=freshwater metagenome TaxID=449393 RepID=A0A6J6IGG4_9ZZZZ
MESTAINSDGEKTTVADRAEAGRRLRQRVPRSTLGDWSPAADRDPLGRLDEQEVPRVAELVPIRHERMAVSPFAFFRGAAAIFADDIADCPRSGLEVQLCGDAHLMNFGVFASPERSLVFDINDFDETLPGPFEWDVKRLAASFEIAARTNGFRAADRRNIQSDLGETYATSMAEFSRMDHIDLWYSHLNIDRILSDWGEGARPGIVRRFNKAVAKARGKDRLRAFNRLADLEGGKPRFVSDPPLLEPVRDLMPPEEHERLIDYLQEVMSSYRSTLQADRQFLLEHYEFVDLARKVVGVGSVGTRCWVALLVGREDGDPLFLQIKEAEPSVLERHLGASRYPTQGQRVVEGQRLMQATSDIFLGWVRAPGLDDRQHDYYFRQLWDAKASADVETMSPDHLRIYAKLCAYTLARGHARSGDSIAISAYLGGGKAFAAAMTRFADAYADQNEADHEAFSTRLAGHGVAG